MKWKLRKAVRLAAMILIFTAGSVPCFFVADEIRLRARCKPGFVS